MTGTESGCGDGGHGMAARYLVGVGARTPADVRRAVCRFAFASDGRDRAVHVAEAVALFCVIRGASYSVLLTGEEIA